MTFTTLKYLTKQTFQAAICRHVDAIYGMWRNLHLVLHYMLFGIINVSHRLRFNIKLGLLPISNFAGELFIGTSLSV